MPVLWQVLLPLPPPGIGKTKNETFKTTPTTPTATLLSCLSLHPSSCIPCSKKSNEQTLKSKTATPDLYTQLAPQVSICTFQDVIDAVHHQIEILQILSWIFHKSCRKFVVFFFNGKILSTPQSPHAELGDLEIEAFLPHGAFFSKSV